MLNWTDFDDSIRNVVIEILPPLVPTKLNSSALTNRYVNRQNLKDDLESLSVYLEVVAGNSDALWSGDDFNEEAHKVLVNSIKKNYANEILAHGLEALTFVYDAGFAPKKNVDALKSVPLDLRDFKRLIAAVRMYDSAVRK